MNYWENIAGVPAKTVVDNLGNTIPVYNDEPDSKPVEGSTINWKKNIRVSKINLTQYAKVATYTALYFGLNISETEMLVLFGVLETLFTSATWILRTFFNK